MFNVKFNVNFTTVGRYLKANAIEYLKKVPFLRPNLVPFIKVLFADNYILAILSKRALC